MNIILGRASSTTLATLQLNSTSLRGAKNGTTTMSLSQQMKLKSHSKKSKKKKSKKKKKKKKKKKMSKRTAVTAVTSSLFGASTDEFDGWTATAELSAPMTNASEKKKVNGTTNSTGSGVSKKGLNATNTTAAAAASKMKMNTTKVTRSGEFVLFCMTKYSTNLILLY